MLGHEIVMWSVNWTVTKPRILKWLEKVVNHLPIIA